MSLRDTMVAGDRFLCGVEVITSRGSLSEPRAAASHRLGESLEGCDRVDWVSISDNAGGHPQFRATTLARPLLAAGQEVLIHLSCKDLNRNGLESAAWELASEGLDNILAVTGDYPAAGLRGKARPVFDLDSVGLLQMLAAMNEGIPIRSHTVDGGRRLTPTRFFAGAVVNNFKRREREQVPQYLKLLAKLDAGAKFVICQIGFDARKVQELPLFLNSAGRRTTPLIGNTFLLSRRLLDLFHRGKIPGVRLPEALYERCQRELESRDEGRQFFLDLAARQVALYRGLGYRGLGYRGVYLGGIYRLEEVTGILDIADAFSEGDWRGLMHEMSFPEAGEFLLYQTDAGSGFLNPEMVTQPGQPTRRPPIYWLSRCAHDLAFAPGGPLFPIAARLYQSSSDSQQGPRWLRPIEKAGKSLLYGCKDCGDCALPETAYLCPEASCAKNQRNGPCGGSRDGLCEVRDVECLWARVYERRKAEGAVDRLLAHAPLIQDQSLRGASAWAHTFQQQGSGTEGSRAKGRRKRRKDGKPLNPQP